MAVTMPLHPTQRALAAAKARPDGPAANCACAYRITGPLDADRLAAAYRLLLASSDALHLSARRTDPALCWEQSAAVRARVQVHDGDAHTADTPAAVSALLQRRAAVRFDLTTGPLARIDLHRLETGAWIVTEVFDHIIADGSSLDLLHAELPNAYLRRPVRAEPLGSYQRVLQAPARPGQHTERYWRNAYQDFSTPPAPPPGPHGPEHQRLQLSPDRASRVERAAGSCRATLAGALLAAHAHAVARYRARADSATFLAIDARDPGGEPFFGQATALLPIRIHHDWRQPLAAHLTTVARTLMTVRDHMDTDLHLLDALGAPVTLAASDATAFVFQNSLASPPELPGLQVSGLPLPDLHQAGGLVTVVRRGADGALQVSLRTPSGSAFRDLPGFTAILDTFLDALCTDADQQLGGDPLLPRAQTALIEDAARPTSPFPYRPLGPILLKQLAARTDAVLHHGTRRYTGHELHQAVIRMQSALTACGVGAQQRVLVEEEDVFGRIAAFLALLALGVVYVPADPNTPQEHRDALASRVRAAGRISKGLLQPGDRYGTVIPQDPGQAGPQNPAYIIFTSGSTGEPKGVVVSHAALSNLAEGEGERFALGPDSRVLLIAPPTVDPWICHVTGALLAGATLVAGDPLSRVPLADQLEEQQVTHAFLPAALVAQLEARPYPHLELLATAGDHARPRDVRRLAGRRIVNIYGPTEATVTATVADITQAESELPVGRPIRGMGARILIDGAASAPPGVPGELILSGTGLALGYFDDPALTADRFRPDPLRPGQRMYLTGDRAVLSGDGQFHISGRLDRQVKVRGFRVELEDVEHHALRSGLCTDARAVAAAPGEEHGDLRLLLFVEGCSQPRLLEETLRTAAPPHLRPHRVCSLFALPRLPSGKPDEARLLEHHTHTATTTTGLSAEPAPQWHEPTAQALAAAWTQVLGLPPGPDSDFFDLGGDSLSVLRLVRLAREASVGLSPTEVYARPRFTDLLTVTRSEPVTAPDEATGSAPPVLAPSTAWFEQLALAQPRHFNQQHWISFPILPASSTLAAALTRLLEETPVLRSRLIDGALHPQPVSRPQLLELCAPFDDHAVRGLLHQLQRCVDPSHGRMLQAAVVRADDGSGTLVLIAHHLVVDDWSWTVIEDRLRRLLRWPHKPLARDTGFARYSAALQRQIRAGAFIQDARLWQQLLTCGHTSDPGTRPGLHEHATTTMRWSPRQVADKWGTAVPVLLLVRLAEALAAVDGPGTSIIDIERNGRAMSGVDLSDAVGWFALHHPLRLDHQPATPDRAAHLARQLARIPEGGLGYSVTRWMQHLLPGMPVGRFAVNISDFDHRSAEHTAGEAEAALARSTVALSSPANRLPHQAAVAFRRTGSGVRVDLTFDPERLTIPDAAALLDILATPPAAPADSPAPRAGADTGRDPFASPLPATLMQRLMLDGARLGPGIYRPGQLWELTVPAAQQHLFLTGLGAQLGMLSPFRTRFVQHHGQPHHVQQEPHTVPIPLSPGGRAAARSWLAAEHIDAHAATNGGPLTALRAFTGPGEHLLLALQAHHAILDRQLQPILDRTITRQAAASAAPGCASLPGQTGTPTADASLAALRKHASAEAASSQRRPQWPTPAARWHRRPSSADGLLPASQVQHVQAWAHRQQVDLRAAFSAAALLSAYRRNEPLYLVANGRDADIPETMDALGLFWYFLPTVPAGADGPTLAHQVFHDTAQPLHAVRRRAAEWTRWFDGLGLAFTYLKSPDRPVGDQLRSGGYDLFHFPAQLTVTLQPSGQAHLHLTTYPSENSPHEELTLECYLAALGNLTAGH
ncbi:AMP-binding protein [Streptomyces sp. NPDC006285]|uniref:AMP-binding protein n=1 Tax=Streptomyces sp. NPDC006285 TaxID=3364742 RepID=UPI0036B75F15